MFLFIYWHPKDKNTYKKLHGLYTTSRTCYERSINPFEYGWLWTIFCFHQTLKTPRRSLRIFKHMKTLIYIITAKNLITVLVYYGKYYSSIIPLQVMFQTIWNYMTIHFILRCIIWVKLLFIWIGRLKNNL